MKVYAETGRLILREMLPTDDAGMFEMDSDPDVHLHLGNNPVKTITETRLTIAFIRQQYIDFGIGRWAVTEKVSGNFIGWAGLKFVTETINNQTNYYDLGYRFSKRYWGRGYATEAAMASVNYAFNELNVDKLYGMAAIDNLASKNVLEKVGLVHNGNFEWAGITHRWFVKAGK